jgi:hypothetical protein
MSGPKTPTVWPIQFNPTGTGGTNISAQYNVQGYHTAVLVVGMLDGSVRGVSASVGQTGASVTAGGATSGGSSWVDAVLPNDGVPLGSDW